MKTFFCKLIVSLFLLFSVFACGKDNYDAPKSVLSGRVTYNAASLGVRGSNQSVYLQLWQDGFPLRSAINMYVTQDGSFSAKLFDGKYKLITTNGNGPWANSTDTVSIDVRGNTTIDYHVKPYYMMRNITYNVQGNILKASFDIETIDASRAIDFVTLLVNDTKFVDLGQYTYKTEKTGINGGHVELELDIKDFLAKSGAVYARVGLRINGITEALYDSSPKQMK